jgi:BASS family bile acid:Na+ symporter
MSRALSTFTNLFPVWVVLGGVAALKWPEAFTWFRGPWIVGGLAVIMLGMGMTLELADFRRVFTMPRAVAIGFSGQYLIMPLLSWGLARALRLETPLAVGLILVGCAPGGTASNVVTYLARANVALSVLMTMCSTLAAVIFTPALTKFYAGAYIPVDAAKLLLDTAQVVLLPVVAGLALHHGAPGLVRWILPVAPPIAVVTIALICASILGQNADVVRQSGVRLLTAVVLLHVGGFGLGYGLAALFGFPPTVCRTVSIEVGMQNSGLATVLAHSNFPTMPSATLPGALSATCHSVLGSLLAGYWRLRPARDASPR